MDIHIDESTLQEAADAGAAAATATVESGLLWVKEVDEAGWHYERRGREAFARAAIQTYLRRTAEDRLARSLPGQLERTNHELARLLRQATEDRDAALREVAELKAALLRGPEWHNPDGLSDPGDGYRFLVLGELIPSDAEWWWGEYWWIAAGSSGDPPASSITYRTRQPLP